MNKKFVLVGVGGFVAPRHLRAIKETGNQLLAAFDPYDSVGIMDNYFPEADFFVEFERFDRHLEKLKRAGNHIDYVSICSPNYLHDAHIRFALRHGADAICEKPLVLNPWNLDALEEIEAETGGSIFSILQLRLHPAIVQLKEKVERNPGKIYDVDLTYITSRGHWYYTSWKGDQQKSGGIATNIGVHFFDMLLWIFGNVLECQVHIQSHDRAAGYLQLDNAKVRWFLSINGNHLPDEVRKNGQRTYRSIKVDKSEMEFSDGFTDLHVTSYYNILSGDGFRIKDVRPSIEVVHNIRSAVMSNETDKAHPMAKNVIEKHPFERDIN